MALYLGVIFIVSLAIIIFGAVVGISAKDQMAAGTLGTPLMMLFLILSLIHIYCTGSDDA